MKKKNTLIGSDFEKICRKICCLKVAELIKSAHRLHIFGIRRFDNTKYFEVAKRISLRKIFIEIDHLPIQPFHCCAPSFPPPPRSVFCNPSSITNCDPFFCNRGPLTKKIWPHFLFFVTIEKGLTKNGLQKKRIFLFFEP